MWSADEIASEYDLDLADIYAALAYYFANREQVDRSIEKSEAFAEQLRLQNPSLLNQKLHGTAWSPLSGFTLMNTSRALLRKDYAAIPYAGWSG